MSADAIPTPDIATRIIARTGSMPAPSHGFDVATAASSDRVDQRRHRDGTIG